MAEMVGATGEHVSGEPRVNGEGDEWGTAGKPGASEGENRASR